MTDAPLKNNFVLRDSFAVAVIVLLNLVVYAQVVGFELVGLDDIYFITDNPQVTGGLTAENFLWSLQTVYMGIWHPLTWFTYQLETTLFGADNAAVRHAFNLLLHIGNSLLVFFIFARLLGQRNIALVLALLFAVHPQHVQVVAWVSERKELLAAFFALLTILFYHRSTETEQGSRWYWLSFGSFLLALLSKPGIVPLPLILVAIDLLVLPRENGFLRSAASSLFNKLPFFAVSLVIAVVAVYANHSHGADLKVDLDLLQVLQAKFTALAGLVPVNLAHYLLSVFIPQPGPFFLLPPEDISVLLMVKSLLIIYLFFKVVLLIHRRYPLAVFGAAWFVLFWLPVSGIIPFARYYVADRYMYMPHIGLFLVIIYTACYLTGKLRHQKQLLLFAALAAISIFAYFASIQASYWKDDINLFRHESEILPQSEEAALYCGWAAQGKDYQLAAECLQRAVTSNPDGFQGHAYLAISLEHIGQPDDAADHYRLALASAGADTEMLAEMVYARLVKLLVYQGDRVEATSVLIRGLEAFPDSQQIIGAYYRIGQ